MSNKKNETEKLPTEGVVTERNGGSLGKDEVAKVEHPVGGESAVRNGDGEGNKPDPAADIEAKEAKPAEPAIYECSQKKPFKCFEIKKVIDHGKMVEAKGDGIGAMFDRKSQISDELAIGKVLVIHDQENEDEEHEIESIIIGCFDQDDFESIFALEVQ